jgi:hypothetical protein
MGGRREREKRKGEGDERKREGREEQRRSGRARSK